MSSEKISVIVPVYNVEAYLSTTLQSLCAQAYDNLEIICINDGSTDGSLEILQDYAQRDARIQIIDQPNGGVSAARNAGLAQCRGTWVSFIDADDRVSSDCYQKLSKHLSASIQMLCFTAEIVYDDDAYKSVALEISSSRINACHLAGELELNNCMRLNIPHSIWNKIYRRDIIERYHIRFPVGIRLGEDMVFHMNYIIFVKKAYFMSDVLYYYMQREGSAMAQSRARGKAFAHEMLYVSSRIMGFHCKHRLLREHIYFVLKLSEINFLNAFFSAAYAQRAGIALHRMCQIMLFLLNPYILYCLVRKVLSNKRKALACLKQKWQEVTWLLGVAIRKFRSKR